MPPEHENIPVINDAPPHALFSKELAGGLAALSLFALLITAVLSSAESTPLPKVHVAAALEPEQNTSANLSLEARSAYVIDLTTGDSLFARNADVQLPLASITKIPLVLVAAEVLQLSENITVSREATERGKDWGLETGAWVVQNLVDFTLVASSNAGAEALAESADARLRAKYPHAPSGEAAVWRMNALAHELGLTKTYFLNPSGLDVSPTQASAFSSAREIALLIAYAAKTQPELFAATGRREATLGPLKGPKKPVISTNEALRDIPGLILGKTGFTHLAGGNLAIVFEIEPLHPIAAVVLGSSDSGRFDDMRKLLGVIQTNLRR